MNYVDPDEERQAQHAVRDESKESDATAEVRVHEDHTRELRSTGFSRMRTEWSGQDALQIASLRVIVDNAILQAFPDAFVIMNDLYDIVREPQVNSDGEVMVDAHGWPLWARTESGGYVEDYSRLGIKEREDFLFRITTSLFEWQQTKADLWGEAMFSKALWEETFARGFTHATGSRPTVDDKTNQARASATEERYFAIFRSLVSRRADAVVDGMQLIGQRLKDLLTT